MTYRMKMYENLIEGVKMFKIQLLKKLLLYLYSLESYSRKTVGGVGNRPPPVGRGLRVLAAS